MQRLDRLPHSATLAVTKQGFVRCMLAATLLSRSLRLLALSRTLEQKGSRDHPTNWLAQTHKDMLI